MYANKLSLKKPSKLEMDKLMKFGFNEVRDRDFLNNYNKKTVGIHI